MKFTSKGNLDLLSNIYKRVGIIGSRNVGSKELETAFAIGLDRSLDGYVVVTGMAAGIDTWAMVGALRDGVNHIAVIPSIDYEGIPQNNHILLEEILEKKGLIIAPENPVKDFKKMYLRRNDLLLEHIDELITVGKLGSGAAYTAAAATRLGIKVTNL
ncbi:MAG: DNA-processing protein DprA [Candidatus Nitrosocosmicus sp.]|nr:DNA-protecting protein DprA [Candidatus Nitrosocosmicus sp.]